MAVDDGSRDESKQILHQLAEQYQDRIQVISHPKNLGVPSALFSGFKSAADMASDEDVIISLEGDGTSDLSLLGPITDRLSAGSDIVIASRYIPGGGWRGFPWDRKLVSRLGNAILCLLFPYPGITDFSIFYRGYQAKLVKKVLAKRGAEAFNGPHFSANAAFLLHCLKEHPAVDQVPNFYIYDLKRSITAFRVQDNVKGYVRLLKVIDFWQVRSICRKQKSRGRLDRQ